MATIKELTEAAMTIAQQLKARPYYTHLILPSGSQSGRSNARKYHKSLDDAKEHAKNNPRHKVFDSSTNKEVK